MFPALGGESYHSGSFPGSVLVSINLITKIWSEGVKCHVIGELCCLNLSRVPQITVVVWNVLVFVPTNVLMDSDIALILITPFVIAEH